MRPTREQDGRPTGFSPRERYGQEFALCTLARKHFSLPFADGTPAEIVSDLRAEYGLSELRDPAAF